VLKWTTEEVDNPDLRDRGFMYWRMLAINPTVAGEIVLAEKPPITTDSDKMDRGALDQLLLHTGTLGSIYHKNPETFIRSAAGKALADSPALNAHSRAVLVPLIRAQLPPVIINIPGDGPIEPNQQPLSESQSLTASSSKPAPPIPSQPEGDNLLDLKSTSAEASGEGDDDGTEDDQRGPQDPYSNLDNAFGGYLADQPKPMTGDDDLLF